MAKKFLFLGKIGLLLLLILLAVNRLPTTYAAATTAPILLITNSAYATNPFGNYLGEILRAEGLNEYDQADLSSISSTQLAQYTVVILADTTLTSAQATTFSNYVNAGGRLIAMHPDPQLAAVFGLGASAGTQQTDGYLKISPTAQINGETSGQGLYTDTMQIHGLSERFTPLAGATVVATLYSDAVTATAYPAITYNVYGSGQAIAFLYDLAKNVVYTRQGNPANANVDVDGDGVFRTIDLFQKQGGGAGWVDLNKVPVPQADMQQRL
ncbi:MAG TPA: hypothetical protein VFM46_04705, partial [Pseudomonadales bacterium]|nr:hypothetical protein [Pseudomonadales bacterium]